MEKHKYPKSMKEVLDIKEMCYTEVEHLSLEDALKKRIDDSLISAESFRQGTKKNQKRNGSTIHK